MSDIVHLLPDSVANQIAAGEVIQRPASVIKELMENAVDAGATTINVLVVDAGRTQIQVIDNGKGMSETDARLSFERHATSKIQKADDLFALQTMGFRGEALASIAAVAQVELKTRQEEDELGTHLKIAGSKFMSQEPCSCPVGANFKVENIFYNVPARRKFLKTNSTELNNILVAFERIALVYPHINFTLHSNGSELYNLKAAPLRQRIVDVMGKKINQDLLPVNVKTTICEITGFVGKPESARKKCPSQYFFVNERYMKHPYFHKAVLSAFERLVPIGEQIPYFIYLKVAPQDIDVNIHPTKTEIKFENEQAIWQILSSAVKESIGVFNVSTNLDFDTTNRPDIPVFDANRQATPPQVRTNPQYNPFNSKTQRNQPSTSQWNAMLEELNRTPRTEQQQIFQPELTAQEKNQALIEDKAPSHYQYKGKYILTAVKSGLMIINQHEAHERVLFEQYMQQLDKKKGTAHKLLFPEMVQLTYKEINLLDTILPELENIGFELADLGQGNYAVNAVPPEMENANISDFIHTLFDNVTTDENALPQIKKSIALSMAQKAAIPVGQILQNEEMDDLINRLFTCENINYSPSGKRILTILSQNDIDSLLR